MIHSCVCEVDGRKSNRILLLLVEWKAFSLSRNSTMLRFSGGVVSAPSVSGNLNRKVEMKIKQKKNPLSQRLKLTRATNRMQLYRRNSLNQQKCSDQDCNHGTIHGTKQRFTCITSKNDRLQSEVKTSQLGLIKQVSWG